jgi:16S rRNA (guanine527-N7)-methyltransferase
MVLTDRSITDVLQIYGVSPSLVRCEQIRTYIELLLRWNKKMALTTITDPLEILRRHFGESMFAVHEIPIRHGRLADVGTGAGFPSIPISMVASEVECVLIESNQKKATFLAEAARTLQLKNIEVFRGRMEDYATSSDNFDFSVSRALGMHDAFLRWSAEHLTPRGKVVYWIGDDAVVSISANSAWNWRPAVRIPESRSRALLIGEPREAPSAQPR